jgi:1,4-dihydroxy-6-naphthoate synthase
MDPEVMKKHIDLYVNDFTRNLGDRGRQAVRALYDLAADLRVLPPVRDDIFAGY